MKVLSCIDRDNLPQEFLMKGRQSWFKKHVSSGK